MLQKIKINSGINKAISVISKNMNSKNLLIHNDINYKTVFESYMHSFLSQDKIVRKLFHDISKSKTNEIYNLDSNLKKRILNEFLSNNKLNIDIKTKINSRENKFFLFKFKKFFTTNNVNKTSNFSFSNNDFIIPIYNSRGYNFFYQLLGSKKKYKFFDFYNHFYNYKNISKTRFINSRFRMEFISKDIDLNFIKNCISYIENFIIKCKPKAIICMEGDNFLDQIFGLLGKKHNIPTICIQWGSLVNKHPKISYTNFSYKYYLAWGTFFSSKLKKYNKKTKFYNVGNIIESKKYNKKNKIIFFLQTVAEPNLDKSNYDQLIELILWSAKNTKKEIIVRSHPSFYPESTFFKKIKDYKNIKFHNSSKVPFTKSMKDVVIALAINSSSLIESLLFDVLPIYFVTNSKLKEFNYDLTKYNNILQFDDINDVKKKINYYLISKNFKNKIGLIKKNRSKFIIYSGKKAKKEMIKKINHIILKRYN